MYKSKGLSEKQLAVIKQERILLDISSLRKLASRAITTEHKKQLYSILEDYQKRSIELDDLIQQ